MLYANYFLMIYLFISVVQQISGVSAFGLPLKGLGVNVGSTAKRISSEDGERDGVCPSHLRARYQ